jgi:predicted metal-dependent phosphoesterase TrpH
MKKIDLHVHSTFSDGTLTPSELVDHALEMGLSAMALTDHDTVDGISEAVKAGITKGLEIIPGIELSTFYNNKEFHIVGLYIDYTDKAFKKELTALRDVRQNRNIQICEAFHKLGIEINYDDMLKKYGNIVITRAHFADYLLEMGLVGSRNEAFDRYLGDNRPCNIPRKKMNPANAIQLIKSTGGVPILAHPTLYHLGKEQLNKLIEYLYASGLVGIEGIYSTYTMGEELEIKNLAKKYNLILSGGSDYHGANKPKLELGIGYGHLCVPYDFLDIIKECALNIKNNKTQLNI